MTKYFSSTAAVAATVSLVAAVAAAFSVPTAAMAAEATTATGHYEWRAAPQNGPRAPLRASVRIWVDASGIRQTEARQTTLDMAANEPSGGAGHYEWRAPRQFGPRAPIQGPTRVWVNDATMVAMQH